MCPSEPLDDILANWVIGTVTSTAPFETTSYRFSGNVTFVETASGQRYVLKTKTNADTLTQEHILLAAIHDHGIPVAVPLTANNGSSLVRQDDAYFYLSPYLPGDVVLDHYAPGAETRARSFGEAIGQLHLALKACQDLVTVPKMDLAHDVAAAGRVVLQQRWGRDAEKVRAIVAELNSGLDRLSPALPTQLIHRDAHAANMLFLDGELSGWLDFEIAVRGPRLFDLGYCGTSLLMNGLEAPAKRAQWTRLLAALVEGYAARNPLTEAERSALWTILMSIEMIFLAYFVRTQDQKGIEQNLTALVWIYEQRKLIHDSIS